MSFKDHTCAHCARTYEFYQQLAIVPDCKYCGTPASMCRPITSNEYYRAMETPESCPTNPQTVNE